MERIETKLFINNLWVDGIGQRNFEVVNPATRETIGSAVRSTVADIKKVINSADQAFPIWSKMTGANRSILMMNYAQTILKHQEEIARILTLEHGKPLQEALGEVKGAAMYIEYYAEQAKRISGEIAPSKSSDTKSLVTKHPVGLVCAIIPWNYPIALASWKIGPALAAGCTIIVKPPEETPLAVTRLIGLAFEAGLPAGVINAVTGYPEEIGDELITNPLTKLITFTGSTKSGKQIATKAAPYLKKLILELGGQSPMIIFDDADLEKAVADAIKRSFRNMGQICNSVNRIYVQEDIAEKFIKKFVAGTKKLTQGNGLDNPKIDLGPMVNEDGIQRVKTHVNDALQKGASLACGGQQPNNPNLKKGFFYQPTILLNATTDMLVMREETFGPVVGIAKFKNTDEALRLANSTNYGLVGYLYTNNAKTIFRFMDEAEFGSLGVNTVSPDSPYAPYPAWKQSGTGLELSHHGLEEYLKLKHTIISY